MPGPEYINPIQISSARRIVSAQPVDDRIFYETIADVTYAITHLKDYTKWHRYMPIYIREINQVCVWIADDDLIIADPTFGSAPVAGTTFQYTAPPYTGETFNFHPIRAMALPHTHTESEITNLQAYALQTSLTSGLAGKLNNPSLGNGTYVLVVTNSGSTLTWTLINPLQPPSNTGDLWAYNGGWRVAQSNDQPLTSTQVLIKMKIPIIVELAAGSYDLKDPALFDDGYAVTFVHDSVAPGFVELNGYAIDNYAIPLQIPQHYSITIAVVNHVWRRVDRYT